MLPHIIKLILPVYIVILWLGILARFLTDKPVAETVKIIREKSFLISQR
ncbi:unnamed protein product [marine sediment metagenome]|uniref:Uncharacterized protein n=1 Tax=marine sediment metagenome TaxID=412755 RepID=X0YRH0_9ZZZZ